MIEIEEQVPLHEHTTLQVGGPAEFFARVRSNEELLEALEWAREHKKEVTVLGGGSNVLVGDEGLRGVVIKNEILGIDVESEDDESVTLSVGSGVVFDDLVAHTVEKGWWGLENLSHIPGSVGATPIQNVGAYGVEVSEVIVRVDAVDAHSSDSLHSLESRESPESSEALEAQKEKSFNNDECAFSYRNSFFKTEAGKRYVITRVVFKLKKNADPKLEYKDLAARFADVAAPSQVDIRNAVIEIRANKFPDWHRVGTAGSFFKNPVVSKEKLRELQARYPEIPHYEAALGKAKIPLGWVLDKVLRLKGTSDGTVGTYEGQALVLVNNGDATAHDFDAFAKKIEEKVFDATGIHIEREVTML